LDQAIADCSKAIELDPKLALAYGGRDLACRDKSDLDQAIADFETYLRLEPKASDRTTGGAGDTEAERTMKAAFGCTTI